VSTPILHLHKYIVSFFLKNGEHILEPFFVFFVTSDDKVYMSSDHTHNRTSLAVSVVQLALVQSCYVAIIIVQ